MWLNGFEASLLSFLLFTSSTADAARPQSVPKNAVLLSSISSLTLRAGKQTSAQRSSPIPQAVCTGPPEICRLYAVDTIRCTNAGSDYDEENVQWTCTAALPEEFKFGSTDVSCEGYASSDDPYVLKGSCGVEYRLLLTEKGEEKYGKYVSKNEKPGEAGETTSDLVKAFFLVIFVVVLLIIVFSFCASFWNAPSGGRRPTTFGGGGGGGGNDDPPPPYDYGSPPRKPRSSYSSTRGSGARQEQWRPGFWTGTLGGAAAGYMAGQRNQPRQQETQQRDGGLFGGGTGNTRGSSWFGGGGNAGEGSSRSYSSSPPAASSSRYTSTGFGGTTRR